MDFVLRVCQDVGIVVLTSPLWVPILLIPLFIVAKWLND